MKKLWIAAGFLVSTSITAVYLSCRRRRYVSSHERAVDAYRSHARYPHPN